VRNIACPQDLRPPARMLLAYIFADEIAHALQGVGRHSKSGIMKAEWTIDDYRAMLAPRLEFTADDVELIRAGLDATAATAQPFVDRTPAR